MGSQSVRNIGLNVLLDILKEGAFSSDALEKLPGEGTLDEQEKRFLRRLVKGVLTRRYTLEAVLQRISDTPLKKLKPTVRVILLMGIYELYYMRTASFAAVHEYVRLTEQRKIRTLKGFVNAVLRRADREREDILSSLSEREALGYSEFLYDRMCAWYGRDTAVLAGTSMFAEEPADLTVLRMQSRTSEDAFFRSLEADHAIAVPTGLCDAVYALTSSCPVSSLQAFKDGLFYIQDLSSALAGEAVRDLLTAPHDGIFRVLDVCASPGGKTVHAADLLASSVPAGKDTAPSFEILSCDLSEEKVSRIEENIGRLKLPGIRTCVRDASVFCEDDGPLYDLVLVDAPCSGIGIIGRKPDIQFHLTEASMEELKDLQMKILEVSARYVRPGGTLLYSTCTLDPEENTGNMDRFLASHGGFRPVDFSLQLPQRLRKPTVKEGHLTLIPGEDPCLGFFIARMERVSGEAHPAHAL